MRTDSFFVLHLSDLHICGVGKGGQYYSRALRTLISDIKAQTKEKKDIIIVVSGDIVDMGNYTRNKKATMKFFSDLQQDIGDRVLKTIVVPGNHDKSRNPINNLLSFAHSSLGMSDDKKNAGMEWAEQLKSFEDFLSLANDICKLFAPEEKSEEIKNTFGVETVNVAGRNICFLRIDTAWCSYSPNDYRKLRISKHQMSQLVQEYNDIKNKLDGESKPIELTVAISHYPLNWLKVEDEEQCNDYFLSDTFLDVDVLMCGHVHDFSVVNHFTHEHSLLTLVTGIGRDENSDNKLQDQENKRREKRTHRYSIYGFNIAHNTCDIIMRKTKDNGDFDYDYSVYAGKGEVDENRLRYPLKVRESSSFIKIYSSSKSDFTGLFVGNRVLELIPEVTEFIALISEIGSHLTEKYKAYFLIDFYIEYAASQPNPSEATPKDIYAEIIGQISGYLYKNSKLMIDCEPFEPITKNSDFFSFLFEICNVVVDEIKDYLSKDVDVEARFLWHNISDSELSEGRADEYYELCSYCNKELESDDNSSISPWIGAIETAFLVKEPVVQSLGNEKLHYDNTWEEKLTLIPSFINNSHDIRVSKREIEARPILAFEIVVRNIIEKDEEFLYVLAYLRIDRVITQLINSYLDISGINASQILMYIQEMQKLEDII